ncbi:MAG: MFS transporter [Candidatus Bathyarchaeota archaeon]|nr:MFS transporter [Candidatus Bathyarchaeota archaeon]
MAQGGGGLLRLTGMRLFAVIWSGQFFSLLGTYMSQFALSIWAWQVTGEATVLALVALFSFGPSVIMFPVAGALVDRWNRKLVMMISDVASGIATIAVFLLLSSGRLEVWHLYVAGAFTGVFQAFQWPAYSASISLMVEKKDYARASGLLSLADSVSNIIAPAAAGILIGVIGVAGVLTIDIATFLTAIGILLVVVVPQPPKSLEKRSMLSDTFFGFRYISERRGLLGLQMNFFASNLVNGIAFTVFTPMIMLRSGDDTVITGAVQSAFGVGGVVGGLALSAWGGPKRRVDGVLLGMVGSGLLGMTVLGMGQTPILWMAGAFLTMLFIPTSNGSNQAIWQSKVPPQYQGRVFATRALIASISSPIGMVIAGPLADAVMTPSMMPGGALSGTFGWLVGVGPGAGIGLLFVLLGIVATLIALSGYAFKTIRDVEKDVPDHDAVKKEEQAPSGC